MSCPQSISQIYQDGFISRLKEEKAALFVSEAKGTSTKHLLFLLTLSKEVFSPNDCAHFLMDCLAQCTQDIAVYRRCIDLFQELAPNLEFDELIHSFPNEDSVTRGLLISICPVPLEADYVQFVFDGAHSQFVMNRISFLRYLERLIPTDVPKEILKMVCGVLESLSNDQSSIVRAAWVKPAIFFLKDSQHIKGFMKRMSDPNEAIEVRVAVALEFKDAFQIAPASTKKLLGSTDNRILAAMMPQIKDMGFTYEDLAQIYNNKDTTIRVFIIRYLGGMKKETIDSYIQTDSDEINNEMIKYLSNHEQPIPYLLKIMENVKQKEKASQLRWRTNFEFLSLPIEILLQMGNFAFEIATKCVFRHPNSLMKIAAKVINGFAQNSKDYQKQAIKIVSRLEAEIPEFSSIASSIITS